MKNKWSFGKDVSNDIFSFVEDFMQNNFQADKQSCHREDFATPINIIKAENQYLIQVIAPGFKKEDFKVSLHTDGLKVSANKGITDVAIDYTKKEFELHQFQRIIELPKRVDADKIEAKYESGILNIHLPYQETSEAKTIKVS